MRGRGQREVPTLETVTAWYEGAVAAQATEAHFTVYDLYDLAPVGTALLVRVDHHAGTAEFGILLGERRGQNRDGSHVHHSPLDGGGAQLFPGGIATSTPQPFLVASGRAPTSQAKSRLPHARGWRAPQYQPRSARFEPAHH
jgi:hypothetical protein